jgi:hypothetical protein
MSQQQRDSLNQMMADFPLDVGGDAVEKRDVFERMMTAKPSPDDVTTTSGSPGGVPTLEITTAHTRPDAILLGFHGGWYTIDHHPGPRRYRATSRAARAPRSCRSTIAPLPSIRIPRGCRTPQLTRSGDRVRFDR